METAYPQLNRSPFGGRYGTAVSYFDFSSTFSASVSGSCLVGAGSWLASELGDATSSAALWKRVIFARFRLPSSAGEED